MSPAHDTLRTTIHRASARAWGIATGLVLGLGLLGATWWLLARGGENAGAHLGRLAHIFPGYDVSWTGGLLGFLYAFVVGYAFGRLLAPRAPISQAERQAELDKHVRLNARSWSLALGSLLAVGLFAVTVALLLRGGERPGEGGIPKRRHVPHDDGSGGATSPRAAKACSVASASAVSRRVRA